MRLFIRDLMITDRFDDLPQELRPVAVALAATLPVRLPAAVAAGHERMLVERAARVPVLRPRRTSARRLVAVVAAVLAGLVATSTVAVAADASRPGDRLYGIDRAMERLQLALADDPATRASVHLAHASERLAEADRLDGSTLAATFADAVASGAAALGVAGHDADLAASVEERIARHITRLRAVRDRLEDQGHASPAALAALERAADRQEAKRTMQAEHRATRPSGGDADDERGGPSEAGKADQQRGQSGGSGKPDHAGANGGDAPRDAGAPAGKGKPKGSSGGAARQGDEGAKGSGAQGGKGAKGSGASNGSGRGAGG